MWEYIYSTNINRLRKSSETRAQCRGEAANCKVPTRMKTFSLHPGKRCVADWRLPAPNSLHSPWNITGDRHSWVICCPHDTKRSAAGSLLRHYKFVLQINTNRNNIRYKLKSDKYLQIPLLPPLPIFQKLFAATGIRIRDLLLHWTVTLPEFILLYSSELDYSKINQLLLLFWTISVISYTDLINVN